MRSLHWKGLLLAEDVAGYQMVISDGVEDPISESGTPTVPRNRLYRELGMKQRQRPS